MNIPIVDYLIIYNSFEPSNKDSYKIHYVHRLSRYIVLLTNQSNIKDSHKIPSRRPSQTSSTVTLRALSRIAIFCAFLGSRTQLPFTWPGEGRTCHLFVSFAIGFAVFTKNSVSIISSFSLHIIQPAHKHIY